MSIFNISRYKKRVKALLVTTLLLGTGVAQAQIVIEGNVYGGGKLGTVSDNTSVTINEGTTKGNVFGGGMGANTSKEAGLVQGNATIDMNKGSVEGNIYGGGEMACVGEVKNDGSFSHGKTIINLNDGTVGKAEFFQNIKEDPDRGHIYGGGKGDGESESLKTFCNVNYATVNLIGGRVYGSVYGGSAFGHVLGNDSVFITGTTVGNEGISGFDGSVFGGGKGSGYFEITGTGDEADTTFVMYKTNGRVAGNNYVKMNSGVVKGCIYGGGRLALTGVDEDGEPDSFVTGNVYDSVNHGLARIDVRGSSKIGIAEDYAHFHAMLESDYSVGDIFGGGQGDLEYYDDPSAGCVANAIVNVTDSATVYCTVFGGGEIAGVGYKDNTNKFLKGTGATCDTIAGKAKIGSEFEFDHDYHQNPIVWTMFDTVNNVRRLMHTCSGNVFGASQGDAAPDSPKWIYLGHSRTAEVVVMDSAIIRSCVFGGAEQGTVTENTYVKIMGGIIGTENILADSLANNHTSRYSYGSVYGGGFGVDSLQYDANDNDSVMFPNFLAGRVYGNTYVDVSAGTIRGNVYGGGNMASVGIQKNNGTMDGARALGKCFVTITGSATIGEIDGTGMNANVYGGGRGFPVDSVKTRNIYANVNSTEVTIKGGYIKGSVYGGGAYSHVLDSTDVIITDTARIGTNGFGRYDGSVFGGGRGNLFNRAAGRVAGNTHVIMDNGTVLGNLYGGGLVALTGVNDTADFASFINNAQVYDSVHHGLTKVEVSGGKIGNDTNDGLDLLRSDHAAGNVYGGGRGNIDEFREDNLGRAANAIVIISGEPKINGNVFGGGQMANVGHWNDYLTWYTTKTGTTCVTITGSPEIGTVKEYDHDYSLSTNPAPKTWYDTINEVRMISHTITGNVYGGGQGKVKFDGIDVVGLEQGHCRTTDVNISGTPKILSSVFGGSEEGAVWGDTKVVVSGGTIGRTGIVSDSLNPVIPANLTGTYSFGNVFGGSYGADWLNSVHLVNPSQTTMDSVNSLAGRVYGNSNVVLQGGTIRGNVYGGGDMASVGVVNNDGSLEDGKCFVTITGSATIGELDGTGLNANVYGGGKGFPVDSIKTRNPYTNVNYTEVTVKGGYIKGSVYGGGAYSHVLDSTDVIITDTARIGTNGFGRYDGSVFGGGRGNLFNRAAGRVAGNTHVVMDNGTVLGNLYGGGLVALIGVDDTASFASFINDAQVYDSLHHGLTKVEVSGGKIGNNTNGGLDLLRCNYEVGNVYGGGRGNIDDFIDDNFGRAANAMVNISGSPTIYGSVFGGGQMANVGHWNNYVSWYTQKTGTTRVTIQGKPTIGMEAEFKNDSYLHNPGKFTYFDTIRYVNYETNDTTYLRMLSHTRTGNVYGGGQGEVEIDKKGRAVGLEQGHCRTTYVHISETSTESPIIMSSVFGGSKEGAVWGETEVHIAGGTIGRNDIKPDSLKFANGTWSTLTNVAPYSFGNVFGGSYGKDYYTQMNGGAARPTVIDSVIGLAGRVYGNTLVDITDGVIRGNVYGGGDMASVGLWNDNLIPVVDPDRPTFRGNARVNVSGGTIGSLDGTGLNAYVFGGGKGFFHDSDELRKTYCNIDSTFVTVSGGKIYGSIFGGGNDSHLLGSSTIEVHTGADIGTDGLSTWDGNIFGGGRNFLNTNHTNGRVQGNVSITMDGGTIQGSIFGGGRMALSGVDKDGVFPTTSWNPDDHGNVTINVSGTTSGSGNSITYSTVIGNGSGEGIPLLTQSDESVGDIFGSGKGDTKSYADPLAGKVTNTNITITGSPRIHGAVFGGGEMASVGHWGNNGKFIDGTGSTTITIGAEGHPEYNPTIGTYKEFDPAYLSTYPADKIWTVYDYDGENYTVTHTCTGNVFGGCQGDVDTISPQWVSHARSKSSDVTVYSGTIMGDVYGGSEQGTMAGNTKVTLKGGTIGTIVNEGESDEYYFGNVYGAGYGSDDPDEDNSTYPNDSTGHVSNATPLALAGRTYGNSEVNLLGGTVRGSVFGGSSYAMVGYGSKGNTTLNIGNETQSNYAVHGNFYGANNRKGTVLGDVEVNVNAGTIGSQANLNNGLTSNVFGGGFGEETATAGDVTVTVQKLGTTAPSIYGDVYGGSALGSVNQVSTDKTTVNILEGDLVSKKTTVNELVVHTGGNVYGGGLGEANEMSETTVITDNSSKGQVNGKITVNVGESYTVKDSHDQDSTAYRGFATIGGNVYGCNNTNGSPQDTVTVNIYGTAHTDGEDTYDDTGFAIDNVFGGGNFANYTAANKTAYVNVFGCDNTIERVFGGGDAAQSPNVHTDIQGGRFAQVFGGGNGERGENYAANIMGDVYLGIHGGQVGMSFGGSNQYGLISGTTTIVLDNDGPCGETDIDEYFCGGNYVNIEGDVNATISCSDGMHVKRLYGGCNQAQILRKSDGSGGNVNLTVLGGEYECVFGGSKGRPVTTDEPLGYDALIQGNVNLTIRGGTIDTVFGGSNIMGNVHGKIIVTIDSIAGDCPLVVHNVYGGGRNASYEPDTLGCYPEVNVINGTISKSNSVGGNVFGGGFGSGAIVTSPSTYGPKVTIGSNNSAKEATVEGNVYGGGDAAEVTGNTTVQFDTRSKVTVEGDVFGGGHNATVNGSATVKINE